MALMNLSNVIIKGIATCVPKKTVDNLKCNSNFTEEEAKKFVKNTGVRFRRISEDNQTTSDLGYEAAEHLLNEMKFDRSKIDGLIFVSQSPDYILPASAIILQNRLNLSKTTLAFDISLGCTGYVYGLSVASSLLQSGDLSNILLICGDTPSKYISVKDKSATLLLGDAASATIIGNGEGGMNFSLNSDGSGSDILKIKSGMFRNPITTQSLIPYKWDDGNIRADNQLFMDGMEIFNFTLREIAKDVRKNLKHTNNSIEDIDFVIYHQANIFINNFMSKKLKIPDSKTPYSLYEYGNTSAATIPLTICQKLYNRGEKDLKLLFCAFGVGLSWGTCICELNKEATICNIIEV